MKHLKKIILYGFDFLYLLKKNLEKVILKKPSFCLRVLIYHDVKSQSQIELFKSQILSLKKEYDFIAPNEFEQLIKSKVKPNKKTILLTFDDGFKSNKKIAEHVLNELNIKALFFIISDFVSLSKNSGEYKKIINNIYPNGPNKEELSKPMDIEDIKFLISTGHQIGCHTRSHKKLSNLSCPKNLESEIILSKIKLEKYFNMKIKHFAFPFGTYDSINKNSLKIISQNYEYIHSGLRGDNKNNSKLIFRDAVNPEMKILRLKSFLSGNADFFYKRKFNILKSHIN